MAAGWRQIRKKDRLTTVAMSDGGDGFGPVVGAALGGQRRVVRTRDAAGRPVSSHWWWDADSKTAVIESARTIGLAQLPKGRFHPFDLDTFGLGAVIQAAERAGASRCLIGVGGSATNDGGFGLARSLGWRFLDASGKELLRWTELTRLARVVPAETRSTIAERIVAVDVRNPLTGLKGCSRIYGPQKGLLAEEMPFADGALRRLARVLVQQGLVGKGAIPGAGAAGGLGFGLHVFWGARIEGGFDVFASTSGLVERIQEADLVITGEGSIDASSLMGKGVGEVVRLCRGARIPCIGLGGVASDDANVKARFGLLLGAGTHLTTARQARENPKFWLKKLGAHAAAEWSRLNP